MAQEICTKCNGDGWYFNDDNEEVNPCDGPGCDGDGFVEVPE